MSEAISFVGVVIRFGQVLMIVALLAAPGAHWGALQSFAWTTMFAENPKSTSLSQALVKTFDGKHPCPLCKQAGVDLTVSMATTGHQLVPDYRIHGAATWRF